MNLNDLPQSVREIAEVIGLDATMKLLGQLPATASAGQRKRHVLMLYVPKRLPADHELVRMIGWGAAHKLVQVFGGEILYPANCRSVFKRMRDDLVRQMVSAGAKTEIVADLFGMTPRNVRNIAATEKAPEDGQADAGNDNEFISERSA